MTAPTDSLAPPHRTRVLVLQGGGALGAYQAGAFEALAAAGEAPDWLAGISIGAINAALIAGNRPEDRVPRLRTFWERCSSALTGMPVHDGTWLRRIFTAFAAAEVLTLGVPGFFRPRAVLPPLMPPGSAGAVSFYDTAPLLDTLNALVDFDRLNDAGPRLSLGAVEVESGNFTYFDSLTTRIGPEHVMASGALPPGFAPVFIDGRAYWDGGLLSNTPLQFVLENTGTDPLHIYQIDLFSARGELPATMQDVGQREKDIRFSSRTRLTTDRFAELHAIALAARRLRDRLPEGLRDDPDLRTLCETGPDCAIDLMHLIHRREPFEDGSKDYEFSRLSMTQHWEAGLRETGAALAHPSWARRKSRADGLELFDFGAAKVAETLAPKKRSTL